MKLDHLQLVVQPLLPDAQQQQQQQQDNLFVRSESGRQSSAAAAARSVSVSLAAGSKPVRVVLPYTPIKAGLSAITGIQVGVRPGVLPSRLDMKLFLGAGSGWQGA